jgi:hypothetical protein
MVVFKFSIQIRAVIHTEFTRAEFGQPIIPGKAVKPFTSTSCLHFRKELITAVHARAEVQCKWL